MLGLVVAFFEESWAATGDDVDVDAVHKAELLVTSFGASASSKNRQIQGSHGSINASIDDTNGTTAAASTRAPNTEANNDYPTQAYGGGMELTVRSSSHSKGGNAGDDVNVRKHSITTSSSSWMYVRYIIVEWQCTHGTGGSYQTERAIYSMRREVHTNLILRSVYYHD